MFQKKNKIDNTIGSILGPEIEVNGDLNVKGNLIVYGKVNGNIYSKGNVNTAENSFVQGNIIANSASVNGQVEGNLDIEQKAILGSTSTLSGDLKAAIITIQEGAQFDGVCKMINNQSKNSNVKKINAINS